jgi:Na+/H+ antiporter NhaD/arsenite permease-like protein
MFWIHGRFSWLFVGATVLLALCVITFDFAWRVLPISFEALLLRGGLVLLVLALCAAGTFAVFKRSRRY